MKFLELYKKWMKAGALPKDGLCNSLPEELNESDAWKLIVPSEIEMLENLRNGGGYYFWGSENKYLPFKTFTPQRQTIMLVAAALNGEFD